MVLIASSPYVNNFINKLAIKIVIKVLTKTLTIPPIYVLCVLPEPLKVNYTG